MPKRLLICLALLLLPVTGVAQTALRIEAPELVLAGVPFALEVTGVDAEGNPVQDYQGAPAVSGLSGGSFDGLRIERAVVDSTGTHTLRVRDGGLVGELEIRAIPGFFSILPPILAITLALLFRQVVISLFAGIWLAATFINGYDIVGGFFAVLTHFVINAVTTKSQAQILVFSFLFGGMVGVITRNGGARGIAELITRYAKGPKGGQLSTMAMALVMFFDDYANVLIRGNLMRPITDKLRISREKLSFLVDTGAASVASTALISTWIGYEVGLIDQGLQIIGSSEDAYTVFHPDDPVPVLSLSSRSCFAFMISATDRDFGPDAYEPSDAPAGKAKSSETARSLPPRLSTTAQGDDRPASWLNGLAPIVAILVVGLAGIYITGRRRARAG